ncbi:MAG: LemA protein [Candidatus Aldehydirespiratoraceae bacterium]
MKGYAAHERDTLEQVAKARQAAVAAPDTPPGQRAPSNMLSGAPGKLFALNEVYPDLKANQNFLSLQEELSSTEGRVADARQFYNDAVLPYNNKIESVPTVFIAKMPSSSDREFFEADEATRSVPNAEF